MVSMTYDDWITTNVDEEKWELLDEAFRMSTHYFNARENFSDHFDDSVEYDVAFEQWCAEVSVNDDY